MSASGFSIILSGMGFNVPEQCVSNDALPKHLDTSDEWIRTRTGIGQRYLAGPGVNTSDMSVAAARQAMEQSGLQPDDIDLLIVGTMSPDYLLPATACLVQSKLGLRPIAAFDLHAACSGFLYALEVATRMLQSGPYRNALIIGSEKMSSMVDWEDRGTCVLFGDGAGAAILTKREGSGLGVLDNTLHSDGSRPELLYIPAGGAAKPLNDQVLAERSAYLKMNGKEIFKIAVRLMGESCETILQRNGLSFADVDWVIPHQANLRIIDSLAKHIGVPSERFILNIDRYANTSAASIPIALCEAVNDGRIQSGQTILMVAFGGGLTWGASLVKWH